ncbi:MAG TPA: DUF2085 domain-containing protein [Thermoanaerobaculia bacterium]
MKRDTKIVAGVLAAISLLILGSSSVCAWAVANGASARWRLLFRLLCHGIERRCLTLFGVPMPICARCTAIYIGLLVAVAAFFVVPLVEERLIRIAMYAAALPIGLDGITQAVGLRESTNSLRLVTGFVAAFAFGLWALTAVEQQQRHAINPS